MADTCYVYLRSDIGWFCDRDSSGWYKGEGRYYCLFACVCLYHNSPYYTFQTSLLLKQVGVLTLYACECASCLNDKHIHLILSTLYTSSETCTLLILLIWKYSINSYAFLKSKSLSTIRLSNAMYNDWMPDIYILLVLVEKYVIQVLVVWQIMLSLLSDFYDIWVSSTSMDIHGHYFYAIYLNIYADCNGFLEIFKYYLIITFLQLLYSNAILIAYPESMQNGNYLCYLTTSICKQDPGYFVALLIGIYSEIKPLQSTKLFTY